MVVVFVPDWTGTNEIPSPLLDQQAPTFALPSLADPSKIVGSATYAGEIALVNVWATWCVGCRAEHDFLMTLAAQDVVPIFGLNWRDQRDMALRWLEQLGDPYIEPPSTRTAGSASTGGSTAHRRRS